MTEKELKKLNRYQLLELIILQTEQMDSLRHELQMAEKALEEKHMRLSNAGSIAEASLQISGIFEAAQAAADIYLEQTENFSQMEEDARVKARIITAEAQTQAEQLLADARQQSDALLAGSRKRSEEMLEAARSQSASLLDAAGREAEALQANAEARMAETLRVCQEREQAVTASIQKIREAFQNQFLNLDSLTQSGTDEK